MTQAPTIETERLTLRATTFADFEAYAAFYASDRAKYDAILDRWDAWHAFAFEVAGWSLRGYGCWSVVHRADNALIGQIGIIRHAPKREAAMGWQEPEFAWQLYNDYEGKGLAYEGSNAALNWLFENTEVTAVLSYIKSENTRSIRLAERLGAIIDTRPEEHVVVYRHLKPENQV